MSGKFAGYEGWDIYLLSHTIEINPSRRRVRRKQGQCLPVGWRRQRLNGALYGAKCLHRPYVALVAPKRQPAGTGRRWPCAFGAHRAGAGAAGVFLIESDKL